MTPEARDLAYRIPWRSSGVRAGAHKSYLQGTGGLFRELVPLLSLPDPRRIAIRASLSDPFERLFVRRSEQPSSVDIAVLVDVSSSMAFSGKTNKIALAADLAEALAACAERAGDTFALLPFDRNLRSDLMLRGTRSKAAHAEAVRRLRQHRSEIAGIDGIEAAAAMLTGSRKLIFLLSDFLWSETEARQAAEALVPHDVVPIELDDGLQIDDLPEWGLFNLRDLETGRRRLIAMRPALKAKWRQQRAAQRHAVKIALAASAREMFTIKDRIDWARFSSYLMHGTA